MVSGRRGKGLLCAVPRCLQKWGDLVWPGVEVRAVGVYLQRWDLEVPTAIRQLENCCRGRWSWSGWPPGPGRPQ